MRKVIIINLSIFVISLLLYWGYALYDTFAYQFDPLAWTETVAPPGMPREDAIAVLNTWTWYPRVTSRIGGIRPTCGIAFSAARTQCE